MPPLNDAVFLAIGPEKELAKAVADGRKGTEMPASALEKGGTLTADQVQVLAKGLGQMGRRRCGEEDLARLPAPRRDRGP